MVSSDLVMSLLRIYPKETNWNKKGILIEIILCKFIYDDKNTETLKWYNSVSYDFSIQ